jgi:hypothetical protein
MNRVERERRADESRHKRKRNLTRAALSAQFARASLLGLCIRSLPLYKLPYGNYRMTVSAL